MDKLKEKIALDQKIIKLLKVTELRHHIAQTNLGPLDLIIRKDEEEYQFLIDSTPLEKEKNDRLLQYFDLK